MSRQKQDIARGLGYCRVSTEDQTKGESLEIQRSRIETICAAERLALAAIYVEEGISGSRPFPPVLKAPSSCKRQNGAMS